MFHAYQRLGPNVAPGEPKVVPGEPEVAPGEPEVAPGEPEVARAAFSSYFVSIPEPGGDISTLSSLSSLSTSVLRKVDMPT